MKENKTRGTPQEMEIIKKKAEDAPASRPNT